MASESHCSAGRFYREIPSYTAYGFAPKPVRQRQTGSYRGERVGFEPDSPHVFSLLYLQKGDTVTSQGYFPTDFEILVYNGSR